jgi:hypothetical protein
MLAEGHQRLADKIWSVANKLRGPYVPRVVATLDLDQRNLVHGTVAR